MQNMLGLKLVSNFFGIKYFQSFRFNLFSNEYFLYIQNRLFKIVKIVKDVAGTNRYQVYIQIEKNIAVLYYSSTINYIFAALSNNSSKYMQQTPNAISILHSSPFLQHVDLDIQASNCKVKQDVLCFEVFDGSQTAKAFINLSEHASIDFTKTHRPSSSQPRKYIINVTKHTYHQYNGKKMLQILNINPQEAMRQQRKDLQEIKSNQQHKKLIDLTEKNQTNNKKQAQNATNGHIFKKSHQKEQMIQLELSQDEQLQEINQKKMKDFEKISDLYADFHNWQILVRVLDSSYKEFNSKQGKLTKLFNMMLVDKTGLKIQTSYFGQDALAMSKRIKKGSVYRISHGQIKQHTFNRNLPEDQSKLTIILSKHSELVEVRDTPAIPKDSQLMVTLQHAILEMNFQKSYLIVAILLQIGEQFQTQKENGKKIYRRNILVGDPESMRSIECLLWNKNISVDESCIFKTVCLKNFKLNNYRDKLSFTSTFKSQVEAKSYAKWNQHLKKIKDLQFTSVNSQNDKIQTSAELKPSEQRTIRELENEIRYLQGMESITSELQVWITFIKFQGKWCYGACNNPKCKKAAQSQAKCQFCGIYNQQTNKKYMLPVELTDFTGSLWLTAFDDFGNEIMKGFKLQQLQKLPENRLKEVAQKMLYQQFRMKVTTKKEGEGAIRHLICGKPVAVNIEKVLLSNLSKIKRAVEIQ